MKAVVVGIVGGAALAVGGIHPYAAVLVGGLIGYLVLRVGELEARMNALAAVKPRAEREADRPAARWEEQTPEVPAPGTTPAVQPRAKQPSLAPLAASPFGAAPPVGAARAAAPRPAGWTRPTGRDWSKVREWLGMEDLEQLLAGRLLAVVGGLALVIGCVFFLGLAFSRGWIGPEARVALGLAVGTVLLGFGTWLLLRTTGNRARIVLGHVLVAVGLAVLSLALFAGTRLYELVIPEAGVAGSFVAAILTAVIAIRARSQLVAAFGLITVLAAPPIMGASATLLTIVFLGAALAGTTGVSLFASWRWLPPLAFLLAAPQMAAYVTSATDLPIALPALGVFWALNAVSAAGEEVLHPRGRLQPSSATLLQVNGVFAVWAGFALLSGDNEPMRGGYLFALGLAHLAIAAFFLTRNGERHPFGMLTAGSGIAVITLAVPVQLGAPWIAMAWAAEAVVLAWIYASRAHGYSGLASIALGLLATGRVVFDYAEHAAQLGGADAIPFGNSSGVALGFLLLAATATVFLVHRREERVGLAGVMVAVVAGVLPLEMSGIGLAIAYALLATGALVAQGAWLAPLRPDPAAMHGFESSIRALADRALYAAGLLASGLAVWFGIGDELPAWMTVAWTAEALALTWVYASRRHGFSGLVAAMLGTLATGRIVVEYLVEAPTPASGDAFPFVNLYGLALGLLLVAAAVAILLVRRRDEQVGVAAVMAAALAIVLPRELDGVVLVAAYAVLAVTTVVIQGRWLAPLGPTPGEPRGGEATARAIVRRGLYAAGLLSAGMGTWFVIADHLPPDRVIDGLRAWAALAAPPFVNEETLVVAIAAGAALAIGYGVGRTSWRWGGTLAAALAIAYLIPSQVGPAWSVLGWIVLAVGLHLACGRLGTDARFGTYPLALAAAAETFIVVAAPDRLLVENSPFGEAALFNGGTLAAAALTAATALRAFLAPRDREARIAGLVAGVCGVYLLSIASVDLFQVRLGGATALEELQKQSQVTLSVLWAVLGVVAFVTGLARQVAVARFFGLALLGVVTLKVFVVDLSSLDVAYRVLSFVALGLLLLGAAYLYARIQPTHPADTKGESDSKNRRRPGPHHGARPA